MDIIKNGSNEYWTVIDGPSRDRLIDAFKYAYDENADVPITFRLIYGYTAPKDDLGCAIVPTELVDVRLIRLEHADGSGDAYSLVGYCTSTLGPVGKPGKFHDELYFRGWYHARGRKGSFQLADENWPE